ncbi:hypothetical protein AeNC1_010369 [Aphanomyces euteiches]|nr:hypothetical protein AeNC1_010369 [Aphanomyces euteiches]
MVIKEGSLFKKGAGDGLLSRKNWKPRYFRLTDRSLEYYCTHTGQQKGCIDLSQCNVDSLQVMPPDCIKTGSSDSTMWRLAINTLSRRFFVAADSETTMHEWAFALLDVFQANEKQQ